MNFLIKSLKMYNSCSKSTKEFRLINYVFLSPLDGNITCRGGEGFTDPDTFSQKFPGAGQCSQTPPNDCTFQPSLSQSSSNILQHSQEDEKDGYAQKICNSSSDGNWVFIHKPYVENHSGMHLNQIKLYLKYHLQNQFVMYNIPLTCY